MKCYENGKIIDKGYEDLQKVYLNQMEKLIDKIRYSRNYHGTEIKNHQEVWNKIDTLYDKLTDNNKYIFDNCIVN